jgi:hypothetical protein
MIVIDLSKSKIPGDRFPDRCKRILRLPLMTQTMEHWKQLLRDYGKISGAAKPNAILRDHGHLPSLLTLHTFRLTSAVCRLPSADDGFPIKAVGNDSDK